MKYFILILILVGITGVYLYSSHQTVSKVSLQSAPVVSEAPTQNVSVPLPRPDDIIHTFFNLINEKRIPEAISMMTPQMIGNDAQKQAWGVMFDAFEKVEVTDIKPDGVNTSTDTTYYAKVFLNTKMNPNSATAPIPYYGYNNGTDVKFLTLEKINNIWKISAINTGP